MRIEISFTVPDAVVEMAPPAALIALLALWLAIRVRRRRRRERELRLMTFIKSDFFPPAENPVIEEIRREIDASHRRCVEREIAEAWRRDGSILLERRKGA